MTLSPVLQSLAARLVSVLVLLSSSSVLPKHDLNRWGCSVGHFNAVSELTAEIYPTGLEHSIAMEALRAFPTTE